MFRLVVAAILILLSWSLFFWLYSQFVVMCLLPYLMFVALLSWVFSRTCLRWCRIQTGRNGRRIYILLTAALMVAAPFYSYFHAKTLASSFVNDLALNVKLESQEIQLTDASYRFLLDSAFRMLSRKYRNVTSVYTLLDPVDEVEERVRNRLQHVYDWKFSHPAQMGEFTASCSADWNRGYEILLKDDGTLRITLEYGYPDPCRPRQSSLRSSPPAVMNRPTGNWPPATDHRPLPSYHAVQPPSTRIFCPVM